MSINIPAETPDESTNPISVEEFERLHPAMLGAIREVIREELAACEEQPVFDHPQDMLLGSPEDDLLNLVNLVSAQALKEKT